MHGNLQHYLDSSCLRHLPHRPAYNARVFQGCLQCMDVFLWFPQLRPLSPTLQLHMLSVGPAQQRGSYRVRAVLYDGFQPLYVGPDLVVGASTRKRPLGSQQGVPVGRGTMGSGE